MPFNSESAAEAGRIGGKIGGKIGGGKRWAGKDPATVRNVQFKISLSADEIKRITDKADQYGISRTELIIRAVAAYR